MPEHSDHENRPDPPSEPSQSQLQRQQQQQMEQEMTAVEKELQAVADKRRSAREAIASYLLAETAWSEELEQARQVAMKDANLTRRLHSVFGKEAKSRLVVIRHTKNQRLSLDMQNSVLPDGLCILADGLLLYALRRLVRARNGENTDAQGRIILETSPFGFAVKIYLEQTADGETELYLRLDSGQEKDLSFTVAAEGDPSWTGEEFLYAHEMVSSRLNIPLQVEGQPVESILITITYGEQSEDIHLMIKDSQE